jgi:uncharacterized protein YndB with AHSA1/START domain
MNAAESTLDGDQLVATRRVSAPVERVWQALTTPDQLIAFWGGDHAVIPPESITVDLRVGGTFAMETLARDTLVPGHRLEFRYEVVDPPLLLAFVEPRSGLQTTIRLTPEGRHTTITIRQLHLPVELRSGQARRGLAGILGALADHLRHPADRHQERPL